MPTSSTSSPNTPPPPTAAAPRTRRSARVQSHDPIIAPGFGTRKDLSKLAAELSQGSTTTLPYEAVEAMMRSRGRGMRHQEDDEDDAAAPAAAPASTAWADFMKEEGVAAPPNNTTTTSSSRNSSKKSAGAAAPPSDDLPTTRVYQLLDDTTRPVKKAKPASTAGVLVQAGTLDAPCVGRTKLVVKGDGSSASAPLYHCSVPTIILSPSIRITSVATHCSAAHSIAIDVQGTAYGWGRNEAGQLGPDMGGENVYRPTPLEHLPDAATCMAAAVGKSHTILQLSPTGALWAVGANKLGQCGVRTFTDVLNFRKCVLPDDLVGPVVQIACGEDFSMALSADGVVYSTGCAEFGQLGNGTTGEHFITANKIAFENANMFMPRTTFCHAPAEKLHMNNEACKVVPLLEDVRIGQIACGKHHTIAVEAPSNLKCRVFSWGCGNYGDLGHGIQADEYFPRLIGVLNVLPIPMDGTPPVASAGATCSLLRTSQGHVYYWGKHRSVGEATMRPKLVDVLANNGHNVTLCAAGGQTVVCSTGGAQTVAWGQGPHGELGLEKAKSSSKPTFVAKLDKCLVTDLACGYGHTLYVVRNEDKEDKAAVAKLDVVDDDAIAELTNASGKKKKATASKKKG